MLLELYEDVPVSPPLSTRRCFGVLFLYWAMQWKLAEGFSGAEVCRSREWLDGDPSLNTLRPE